MSKCICTRCGGQFEESEVFVEREYHDEIPGGYFEELQFCPYCGSDDFEDAGECKKCGADLLYGKLLGGYYCEGCVREYMTLDNLTRYAEEDLNAFAEWMKEDLDNKKAAHRSDTSMNGKGK